MRQQILTVFQQLHSDHSGWLGMSDLKKVLSFEPSCLRDEINKMISEKILHSFGKKRGKKYGLTQTTIPTSSLNVISDSEIKSKIESFVKQNKKQYTRKDFCIEFDLYDAKLKSPLFDLVNSGVIITNGKKRGQLFWHKDHSFVVENKATNIVNVSGKIDIPEEEKKEYQKIDVLISDATKSFITNKEYETHEMINEIYHFGCHNFKREDITSTVSEMLKSGRLLSIRCREEKSPFRLVFWRSQNPPNEEEKMSMSNIFG